MKTDRFADSIRRKLDSIRPEFSERDWERMQATLNQASPTTGAPTPSAHPFAGYTAKLAVAGLVGTAVFLSTTIWQHYEVKHLQQTLQQVTQKANRPATNAPDQTMQPDIESGATEPQSERLVLESQRPADAAQQGTVTPGSSKRDTVYIDRYITVPDPATRPRATDTPQLANQRKRQSPNDLPTPADASNIATQSGNPAQHYERQGTDRLEAPTAGTVPSGGTIAYPKNQESTLSTAARRATNREMDWTKPVTVSPSDQSIGRTSGTESVRTTTTNAISGANNAPASDNSLRPAQPVASTEPPATGSVEAVQPTIAFEPLTALPMQPETVRWDVLLAQRARRMRPARTTVVSSQASSAPAVQRVKSIPFQIRAGLGADINTQMNSLGAYAEVVAFNHLSLAIGLSQAKFGTSFFPNIPDFDRNNRQDFRMQYARGFDPRFEIIGIQLYTKRVQLPISLGYRIPVSPSLAILPTIGTDLTLQNQQYISFYHQLPYKMGYEKIEGKSTRPIDLFNNLTVGASLEWQAKHWAAQAGPLITAPLQPDPGCQQNTTIGLRARLFYQF